MWHDIEDHDRGLVHDLEVIGARMVERWRALAFLFGSGTALALVGCGGGGGSSSSSSETASTSSTTSSTSSTSGACIADPSETAGPYPADGTNTASGSTSNVLTQGGIVRSDIRSSLLASTTTAQGVKTTLALTLVDASDN